MGITIAGTEDELTKTRAPVEPGVGRALGMLALPAVMLTAAVFGYMASRGGALPESEVRAALPYLIAASHTAVFVVLLFALRREGRRLGSIGWRMTPDRPLVREAAVGLLLGLAFYLLKELAFDPVRALADGARPTFTTLFRFRWQAHELPLLAVATTFIAVEESVYRGYGLPPLRRRWGTVPALLVMGVLFGLLHWGNGVLAIVLTGILGVLFGLVYFWRGTLLAPLVAHASYNAFVILA